MLMAKRMVKIITLAFFATLSSFGVSALEITQFQNKLQEANSLEGISPNSPEAMLLQTLNDISDKVASRNLSAREVEKTLTLLESTDLLEEKFPKQAVISFQEDFLAGSDLSISDLTNASFFLNSLNEKKIEKLENIQSLLGEPNSQIRQIQQSVISMSGVNVSEIITQFEAAPEIDLAGLSSSLSQAKNDISSSVQQAETAIGTAVSSASNDLDSASSQINAATSTLSFAAGAAMAAAAYSLDQAATAISNTISAGVAVDLEAASQGLGFDDFASAVEAYNQQYGTSYTTETAKDALGQ